MSEHTRLVASNAAGPQLEMFVLQHRGLEMDFSWQWPAAASQVSLADMLSAVVGVDATLLAQLQACSLQRLGSEQQAVWLLANGSPELLCCVNAQVLAAGSQLRLAHGDEIELGLMRLLVALEPSQGIPALPDWAPPHANGPATDQDTAGFALTDLDLLPGTLARADVERQGLMRSDFGDLIALTPQEPVPVVAPVGPTAEHVEEVPQAPAPWLEAADFTPAVVPATNDPLAVLHARYLAKLRNPALADADDLWQDLVRGGQTQQSDPMQQWMQAAGGSPSLDDLLGQQHSIAAVIQGLDALGSVDVLAPEPFDSIMHLFAPENLRDVPQQSLQSLVQHSLPGLSQREHHSMSLDSAMPFVGGESPLDSTHSPNP